MDIYLLRHGIAVDRAESGFQNDFDRALTSEGRRKLGRVVKAMRELDLSFDRILSSPYVRARETAELVAAALGLCKRLEFRDSLGADASPHRFASELRKLRPACSSILLVGHEPFLSMLGGLLISGTVKPGITLKKAGLCKLSLTSWREAPPASLEWLLTPQQMLLMT